VATLNLGWDRQETRSTFSRQTDTTAQFSLTPANLPALTLGYTNTGQQSVASQLINRAFTFALNKATTGGALSFNGSVSAIFDGLQPQSDGVTRSGQLQYSRQGANGHALGIGVSGSNVSGAFPTATVGQSIEYSFPFGGHVGPHGDVIHGLSLQLSGSNSNARSFASGGEDNTLDAILSYHLSSHFALSVHGEGTHHNDIDPANSTHASSLRLRLDANL
jgi:hypothetical protein